MTGGQAALFEEFLDRLFEFQQADGVCNGGAVFAGTFGDLLLGEVEFVGQALKCVCLLDGIEILALEVLDQRHFERHLITNVANDGGHTREAAALGSAPAALTSDQLIALADSANNERLYDAARPNRAGELFERLLAEARSRLIRARIDQVDVDLQQAFRLNRRQCHRRCRSRRRYYCLRRQRRLRLRLPYQRAQSPAQRVSGHSI